MRLNSRRRIPILGRKGRIPVPGQGERAPLSKEGQKEALKLRLFFRRPPAEAERFFEMLDGLVGRTFKLQGVQSGVTIKKWEKNGGGIILKGNSRNIDVGLSRANGKITVICAYPEITEIFVNAFPNIFEEHRLKENIQ